jgi:23S rRNA (guanosine2251-2'-O)-methyltransferase
MKDRQNSIANKLTAIQIHSKNRSRTVPGLTASTLIWLHNIRSMHNIGSIFRTADAFAAAGIVISGYSPVPPRQEITKTALGADETVNWIYFDTAFAVIEYLRKQKYTLIGLEQTDKSVALSSLDLSNIEKICIIPGNEIHGIDSELMTYIDIFTEIPQYGNKHSLNVSVATGIAIFAINEKALKLI